MPRFALTVRLNTSWNTLNTSVVGHHVLHEEIVNGVTGRHQVFLLHGGPDIVDHAECGLVGELGLHVPAGILVPRVDHGQLVPGPQAGLGIGRSDELGQLHDVGLRSPVYAAG